MGEKAKRRAERCFVLDEGLIAYRVGKKLYSRSETMLISNKDAVKNREFFERFISAYRKEEDRCLLFQGLWCDRQDCFFKTCGNISNRLEIAKQALRICRILDEEKANIKKPCCHCIKLETKPEQDPEPKYGDLFEWVSGYNVDENPCMYTYAGLVSLKDPQYTWGKEDFFLNMKKGYIKKLPSGYIYTVVQK